MEETPEALLIIKQNKPSLKEVLKVSFFASALILWVLFDKDYREIRLPLYIITSVSVVLAYILMYKFPSTLTLTPDGFQLSDLGRSRSISWNSIEYFQIKKDTIVWRYITSYSKRCLSNKINRSFMGFDDNLPKNFEMEPEDLVTLLNEWKRKYATGYTYAAEIRGEKIAQDTKEFIDANPFSITSYGLTWLFIIFPVALLYILITSKPSAKLFVLVMVILCFIFIFFMFIFQRKFYVSKIITDNNGLVFNGLLKKVDIQWHEILSIGLYSTAMGEVKTRKGNFLFPLSMKNKYKAYPKMSKLFSLKSFSNGIKWIDLQGNEKPMTLENCPLYEEIQSNLEKTPKSSLVNEPITESKENEILKKGMVINWVIWAGMFASLCVYSVIGYFVDIEGIRIITGKDLPIGILKYILYLLSAFELVVIYFLRRLMLTISQREKQSLLDDKTSDFSSRLAMNKYMTTSIVTYAFIESIGIYGLMLFFMSSDLQTLCLFNSLAAITLIAYRPKMEDMKKLNIAFKRISV